MLWVSCGKFLLKGSLNPRPETLFNMGKWDPSSTLLRSEASLSLLGIYTDVYRDYIGSK